MTEEPALSLRERKKLDTRRALSDAALELAFERGLDNVLREDIAARAGVSVRTFNNYFSGKWEALAYRQVDRLRRSTDILRSRPADEPMWTALTESVLAPLEAEIDAAGHGPPTAKQLAVIRALFDVPGAHAAITAGLQDDFVAAIAERSGTDPHHDLYPRLAAGMVVAVVRSSFEVYVRADPPVQITAVLRRAFSLAADVVPGSGVPAP
ncbi:TetR/AcrR family transcriptional regulator [Nocardia sp. NPDC051570]|uniref:TetR/AcrR family transcriptional regulator n=1 Tax=Nocardia sp. NPDC051570 TaxID=3364324 RepID=UPI00379B1B55